MKKNFKTKIAAGIVAVATAASSSAPAFAAGIDSIYDKLFSENTAIDIVYNGEVLTYTDAQPQNINDRVMIPFRTVLETMGAKVDYNDATRVVTAVRGDTTITFSLDGSVIDIDKNGEKSQITMDVPMAVVNDRTLVPIRFMSNALGMNVGWEGDMNTVVILDSEAYINELKTLPNISKLMQIKGEIPAVQNGAFTIAVDFASTGDGENLAFDIRIDTAYDVTCTEGVIGGKAALTLDIDGLNDVLKKIFAANVNLKNIENANIDVVADNGVVYFKTDLIEKLAAAYPDAKEIQSVAKFADKNTWFKWDMEKTFDELAQENASFKPIADMVKGGITGMNNMTGEDAFKLVASREGDVSLYDVISIDSAMNAYAIMDKYIKMNIEENGNYTMTMDIPKELLTETMGTMGFDTADESVKKVLDGITFSLKGDSSLKDGKSASSVDFVMGMDIKDGTSGIKLNIKMTATSTGDMNGKAEKAEVPKSALDVMDIINALN